MSNPDSYKEFARKIASIQPSALNAFGAGIPGVGGASMANRGGSTESELIRSLNLETHKLLSMLSEGKESKDIDLQKQVVEAALKSCAVVGLVIDQELESVLKKLKELK